MIDTEKKKYVAELCNSVYGRSPKDVIPVQKKVSLTIQTAYTVTSDVVLERPVFLTSLWFAHSKKVSGMQNFMCFGDVSTSKTMQVFDSKFVHMIGDHVKVTSSEIGDVDLTLVGYECIF